MFSPVEMGLASLVEVVVVVGLLLRVLLLGPAVHRSPLDALRQSTRGSQTLL